jgi:hypothetical protein
MTAERHLASTLRRAESLLGRPLAEDETAYVATVLIGWVDMLAAGLTPSQVVAVTRQEAQATTTH